MSRPAGLVPAFVGRDTESARLAAALATSPAVVLVEGEAGIGKSRLVHEFLATELANPEQTLVMGCLPFRQPPTLGPVIEALRQRPRGVAGLGLSNLAGALRPFFPEWSDDLPPLPEPAEDATASRHRLFRALTELLDRQDVTLLAIEDGHWADEATLEWLLYLTSRESPQVSMVVTYRPTDVGHDSLLRLLPSRLRPGIRLERITLQPLSETETASLMSSMLDDEPVAADFAGFLHSHTDGIPFAVEEMVRLMRDRSDIVRLDGQWTHKERSTINVPPTVRDAVLEHVQRLSATAQSLLRALAVLGSGESEQILATVTGLNLGDTRTGLRECQEGGLLHEEPGGRLSFRHALASRAVYESVPGVERRALHQRAGLALENAVPREPAKLAGHFRESNDYEKWAHYAEQAAELALASGDETSATFLLYDVVVNAQLPVSLMLRLIHSIYFSAFPNESYFRNVAQALNSALDTGALETAEEAFGRFQLGRMFVALDDYSSAQEQFMAAVPGLPAGSDDAIRAMSLLGWPRGTLLDRAAHLSWLDRAAKEMDPSANSDYLISAVNIITARLMLGDEAGWELLGKLPEPRSARDELQMMRAEWNAGDLALHWGRYAMARQQFTQARERSVEHGRARQENEIAVSLAHLDWLTGQWDGLAERLEDLAHADLDHEGATELLCLTGLLDAALGADAKAEPRLLESFRQSRDIGNIGNAVEPAAALARIYLSSDRVSDAAELTKESIDFITLKGIWIFAPDIVPARAGVLAATGDLEELQTLAATFADGLGGRDAPAAQAALKLTRAILAEAQGRHAHAACLFAAASEAWQSLPRPYDALLAQEREARCLLAAQQDDDAKARLSSAFEGLYRLGARGDASRLMKTLRRWGVAARWPGRGGRPSYGNQLSPREADVVRLLIDGRTNRQIAEVLVLSTQTVASHLHSAMRKLGVSSRTALAVRAAELGMAEPGPAPETGTAAGT